MSILAFFYSLRSFSLGDLTLAHNFSCHLAFDDSPMCPASPDFSSELQTHIFHHLMEIHT